MDHLAKGGDFGATTGRPSAPIWAVALVGVLALFAAAPGPAAAAVANRPNVLFIVTDDQRLDGTMAVLPKTKEWFHEGDPDVGKIGGTFYPNGLATTPLCCPARATIFTGLYMHHHQLGHNAPAGSNEIETLFEEPWADNSIQAYLKGAGYRTGIFGRYFPHRRLGNISATSPPPFWDDWAIVGNSEYSPFPVNERGDQRSVWQYETDYIRDRAKRFLLENTGANDPPWFLYVAPNAPHGPHRPAPRDANDSVPELNQDQSSTNFFEQDRSDKPPTVRFFRADPDDAVSDWRTYLRTLPAVDDLVDEIMSEVEDRDPNTIAIFTADNGYMMGAHGLVHKEQPYLESVNVPFFLRWPGQVPSNHTDNRFVGNVDMAPTAIDAVNQAPDEDIDTDPEMDGQSLVNPEHYPRLRMLTEHCGYGSPPTAARDFQASTPLSWASINAGKFQYTEHYRTSQGLAAAGCPNETHHTDFSEVLYREYYNLIEDRPQKDNLLEDADQENDPPTERLNDELAEDRTCIGFNDCTPSSFDPMVVPAEISITSKPEGTTGSTTARFTFTTNDPTKHVYCKQAKLSELAAASYALCPIDEPGGGDDPLKGEKTYQNLTPGEQYGFSVIANGPIMDSDTETYSWTVSTNPETTIVDKPDPTDQNATFTFQSSQSATAFMCSRDGMAEESCGSGTSGSKTYLGLAENAHTFQVRAVVGPASDPTPATHAWSIDATAPSVVVETPYHPSQTSDGVTFRFSCPGAAQGASKCSDDTATDVRDVQFECTLKEGLTAPPPFRPCGASIAIAGAGFRAAQKTYTGLQPNTTYTLMARAVDPLGNRGPTTNHIWQTSAQRVFSTTPDASWPELSSPQPSGATVKAIIPDGSGGWFVGGDFVHQVGQSSLVDVMHITSSRQVDTNWAANTASGSVNALALYSGKLYVGGNFTDIDGGTRDRLVALDASNGNVVANWTPTVQGGAVHALALAPPPNAQQPISLIVGGQFTNITNTQNPPVTYRAVAQIPVAGTTAVSEPATWNPHVQTGGAVYALAVTERSVYMGGYNLRLEGETPFNNLREIDRFTAQPTTWMDPVTDEVRTWNPDPRTASDAPGAIYSLELRRDTGVFASSAYGLSGVPGLEDLGGLGTILVGGTFDRIGAGTPKPTRTLAAQINLSDDGTATPWDPALTRPTGIGSARDFIPFHCVDSAREDPTCSTLIGGAFDLAGTTAQGKATEVDGGTGALHNWNPQFSSMPMALACQPSSPVNVSCDTAPDRVLAVGGQFLTVGGSTRPLLAFFGAASP